jgi:hypothetical protein
LPLAFPPRPNMYKAYYNQNRKKCKKFQPIYFYITSDYAGYFPILFLWAFGYRVSEKSHDTVH